MAISISKNILFCIRFLHIHRKNTSNKSITTINDEYGIITKNLHVEIFAYLCFKTKNNLIYIENIKTKKVLESKNDGKVSQEDYEEGKAQQLWKKGEPNAEGYFTLENFKGSEVMTATSSTTLELKGKINKHTT